MKFESLVLSVLVALGTALFTVAAMTPDTPDKPGKPWHDPLAQNQCLSLDMTCNTTPAS